MCGIVGYLGDREVVPLLVDGLAKLEYRGYDSAGVVVATNGDLRTAKAEGKLVNLRDKLASATFEGSYGLGHTRWATHGPPSERNAHPVTDAQGRVALIHNGIIENFVELKQKLSKEGWTFNTDTDTEVVANLVSSYLEGDLLAAVRRAVDELEGMYAFAVIATGSEEIVAARSGPPLVLGLGEGEQFLASDPAALLSHTRDVIFLEDGEIARLTRDEISISDRGGVAIERQPQRLLWDPVQIEKGGYRHFMLKEIHEQPQAVQDTLAGRLDFETGEVTLDDVELDPEVIAGIERIQIVACGTSWHAGQVGKFLIEGLAGIPTDVDYGSEYRYRDPITGPDTLTVGISQSGETADTLSAMAAGREKGSKLLAVCNVQGSQATRVSDGVIYTHAGPEIGVASTKAFTTQLIALYLLALKLAQLRGHELPAGWLDATAHLPQALIETLELESDLESLAHKYSRAEDFLYLGRGINYPIALEGALKLKEISYIHAEGYPAGEMKHGPIALIDEKLPVVAIATGDRVFEKVVSNVQEVKARGGIAIVLADRDTEEVRSIADEVILVPQVDEWLQPIVNVIPLQLLAYFIGVRRGADVDQPRNLAKSVTVE